MLFCGIDWATARHHVCLVEGGGRTRAAFGVDHTAEGLDELVRRLGRHGEAAELPVAIERPNGLVVDRLLEAGHPVVPLKTTAVAAWRAAEFPSGTQSDPEDAWVIASYLRANHHRLAPLEPYSEALRALRAASRARTRLVRQRVAVTNQLRGTLEAFWPGPVRLFSRLDAQVSLAFLRRYPTPQKAARLGEGRMAAFLSRQGYTGRRSPEELVRRLRAAPRGLEGPEAETRGAVVGWAVGVLEALNEAIERSEGEVRRRLGEHPDEKIFTSLPHSGEINAAQMLAEWGDCRPAYGGPEAVAALAGVNPVTRRSGKKRTAHFRWACNKHFRDAVCRFADNSRRGSAWAAEVYGRARARGQDHPHALRTLARAWIRVIWACWVARVPYDVNRHGAAQALMAG